MRTRTELLDMLKDYVEEDYENLINEAGVNDEDITELEEELSEILEAIKQEATR